MIPDKVLAQYKELTDPSNEGKFSTREECEREFGDLIDYVLKKTDLTSVIRSYGIPLKPLSTDSNVLVGSGCPTCGGGIYVK